MSDAGIIQPHVTIIWNYSGPLARSLAHTCECHAFELSQQIYVWIITVTHKNSQVVFWARPPIIFGKLSLHDAREDVKIINSNLEPPWDVIKLIKTYQ